MKDEIDQVRVEIYTAASQDAGTVLDTGVTREYELDWEQRSSYERQIIEHTDPDVYAALNEFADAIEEYRGIEQAELDDSDISEKGLNDDRMFESIDNDLHPRFQKQRTKRDGVKIYSAETSMKYDLEEIVTRYQEAFGLATDPQNLRELMTQHDDFLIEACEAHPDVYEDIYDHLTERDAQAGILEETRWPMYVAELEAAAGTVQDQLADQLASLFTDGGDEDA